MALLPTSPVPLLHPVVVVDVVGQPATTHVNERFQGRLIGLQLRDLRGMEADQLQLVVDDHDNIIRFPRQGVEIQIQLGWPGAVVNKGRFLVDEIAHDGPPDRLTLTCHSPDIAFSWSVAKERSWHGRPLEQIVNQLAQEHQLTPTLSESLKAVVVPHVDQTNETDQHFVTRLAERYDAIATVKDRHLLFLAKGRGQRASGNPLPTVELHRRDNDRHYYRESDKETRYTGVVAYWDNKATGERVRVVYGSDQHPRVLRDPVPTQEEALAKAQGEWQRLKREQTTMSLTLALGRPDIIPEAPCKLVGWKPQIDQAEWVITEVTHEVGDNGFTTSVDLELIYSPNLAPPTP